MFTPLARAVKFIENGWFPGTLTLSPVAVWTYSNSCRLLLTITEVCDRLFWGLRYLWFSMRTRDDPTVELTLDYLRRNYYCSIIFKKLVCFTQFRSYYLGVNPSPYAASSLTDLIATRKTWNYRTLRWKYPFVARQVSMVVTWLQSMN